MAEEMKLTGVLDSVDEQGHASTLTLGDVVEGLGSRGYGPLLIAICLIELLPTGAIPGVPTLVGLVIVLIAGQLLFGRSTPWIPGWLRHRSMDRRKFEQGRDKVKPFTEKVDRVIHPRLKFMTDKVGVKAAALLCVLLALTFPPLELIPFASSIPSLIIALIGLGLSARDGALLLGAFIAAAVGALVGVGLLAF